MTLGGDDEYLKGEVVDDDPPPLESLAGINLLDYFTGEELVDSMFSGIPGFRNHGDGTWSITPVRKKEKKEKSVSRKTRIHRHMNRYGQEHVSIADKRRAAKSHRQISALIDELNAVSSNTDGQAQGGVLGSGTGI